MDNEHTREVLLSMMRENHGGGWPGATPLGVHNRTKDLEHEPIASIIHYGGGDWDVCVSTYQWLSTFLRYDERIDYVYQRWQERHGTDGGQRDMKGFFKWYSTIRKDLDLDFDGVHYTYNWENPLSQDFQYAYIEEAKLGTWVLLQTHNGVDARDGLANIRVFELTRKDDFLSYNDVEVSCAKGHRWAKQGSHEFYADDDSPAKAHLDPLPRTALREDNDERRKLGVPWWNKDGVLICPLCHKRNPLYAYAYV